MHGGRGGAAGASFRQPYHIKGGTENTGKGKTPGPNLASKDIVPVVYVVEARPARPSTFCGNAKSFLCAWRSG